MWTSLAFACAQAILDSAVTTAGEAGVPEDAMPQEVVVATGDSIPTGDACAGMLWTRVGNTFPTDGSGAPATATRFDSEAVAWAHAIEVGVLFCHQNITEDGSWIDSGVEVAYAERDNLWASILLATVGYRWRDSADVEGTLLGEQVMGQVLSPWQPVGPSGGISGGIVVATVITRGLALCP